MKLGHLYQLLLSGSGVDDPTSRTISLKNFNKYGFKYTNDPVDSRERGRLDVKLNDTVLVYGVLSLTMPFYYKNLGVGIVDTLPDGEHKHCYKQYVVLRPYIGFNPFWLYALLIKSLPQISGAYTQNDHSASRLYWPRLMIETISNIDVGEIPDKERQNKLGGLFKCGVSLHVNYKQKSKIFEELFGAYTQAVANNNLDQIQQIVNVIAMARKPSYEDLDML